MATKIVSLRESSYKKLRSLKRDGESFSDVIDRLTKPSTIRDFHGALSDDTAESIAESVRETREKMDDDADNRLTEVMDAFDH